MSAYVCLFTVEQVEGASRYFTLVGRKRLIQSRDLNARFTPPLIVYNNPGQLVYPGGKRNESEELMDAALREFEEETGIHFHRSEDGASVSLDSKNYPLNFESNEDLGYSCVYIKVSNLEELNNLASIIRENINSMNPEFPISDELADAQVLELKLYHNRVPSPGIIDYCKRNFEVLSKPKDLRGWRDTLRRMDSTPVLTTVDEEGTPAKLGVKGFTEECYNMGPFMEFLRASEPETNGFDFAENPVTNRKTYFFLKKKKGSLPVRFSTDWFSAISERIPHLNM